MDGKALILIPIFELFGVLMIISSVLISGLVYPSFEDDIKNKENQLTIILKDLELFTLYTDRAIMSDNFKRVIQYFPNSSEKDSSYLINGIEESLNNAGDALIGGLGDDSPITHSQFSELTISEKIKMNNDLGRLLTNKYNAVLSEKKEKEQHQRQIILLSTICSVLGLMFLESRRVLKALKLFLSD